MIRLTLYLVFFLNISQSGFGQDIESGFANLKARMNGEAVKMNGHLSLSGNASFTDLSNRRLYPWMGKLNASVNFDVLGVQAPFSMNLGTGGTAFNYTLPSYAFVGLSPSYKWLKLHLGDRNMALGKYSFSGQSFKGIGWEIKPGKWEFSGFYGKIRRSAASDLNGIQRLDPVYRRMGGGVKLAYQYRENQVAFSCFSAWDAGEAGNVPDSVSVFSPAKNGVISLESKHKLSKALSFQLQMARSAYTYDNTLPLTGENKLWQSIGGLVLQNTSTANGNAVNGVLRLKTSVALFEFGYEKVDPGFRTMGSLFFRNDLENVSVSSRFALLQKKLLIAGKAGLQRNNLRKEKAKEYNRVVLALQSQLRVNSKLDLALSYNTFNNVNRTSFIGDINQPISITSLTFVNSEANALLNYQLENRTEYQTQISWQTIYNQGKSIMNDDVTNQEVSNFTSQVNVLRNFSSSHSSGGLFVGYSSNGFESVRIHTMSFGTTLQKNIPAKNVEIGTYLSYGLNKQVDDLSTFRNSFLNGSLFGRYRITSVLQASLSSNFYKSFGKQQLNPFYESRTYLSLSYQFKSARQ